MKLGILFRIALYRELRNSIGYYDARRIMRSIEKNFENFVEVDDFNQILKEGFDQRQVDLMIEIAKKESFLLKIE